jgi:predicted N-acetyltransferase YhbS
MTGSAEAHARQMTIQDISAGIQLVRAAGWNQTEADWNRFLDVNREGCFVAESEGEVCGTVATIIYDQELAWIGMVLVRPSHRRRGIGTQLVRLALKHLDSRGLPTIKLDATPQGAPVYERLGFVPESEIERWVLTNPSPTSPESRVKGPDAEVPCLESLLEWDLEVFGADRSALLRSLHLNAPEFTIAISKPGELRGYAFGRRGLCSDHFGPWVAQDPDAARDLLGRFISQSGRDSVIADCFKPHPFASGLLRSAGFEFSRSLTRMVRGTSQTPGDINALYAILGPEFG